MSHSIDVRFPKDQQEGTEATVARWLVAEGDEVAAHQPLAEVETDKVVVEVAAPEAGRVAAIRIGQDQAVNPGDLLCTLEPAGGGDRDNKAEPAAAATTPAETTGGATDSAAQRRLSPAVRQRVAQHGLDVTAVKGSGRGGRITLKDVEALIDQQRKPSPAASAAEAGETESAGSEIVPHDKMRKRIAANMVDSLLHTAPHVTAVFEADLGAVMRHRAGNKAAFAARGAPLTLSVYFIAAAVAAIRKVPRVNSRWFDEHLEIFKSMNIGIGTALGDDGLIVPVLHDAQDMNLEAIAAELARLTALARDGKLKPQDVRGGTFTISNHGVSGSLLAAPIIINQPQSAILGIGKIEKRVKIMDIDGEDVMAIRPMCYVTLTVDHRVLDGYQTNAFLKELVHTLENWK